MKGGLFKKVARLRGAASAKPGPARPQGRLRAERTLVREHENGPAALLDDLFEQPSFHVIF